MVAQYEIEKTEQGNPALSKKRKNSKTTSGRSPNRIIGLEKSKPKGGAPRGNLNALKNGRYTAARRARRKEISKILSHTRALLRNLKEEQALLLRLPV